MTTTNSELDIYSEEELHPPTWLNEDFFTKVIQKCENSTEVKLKNFKLAPASTRTEHYASIMFRLVVDYERDNEKFNKSLILKMMPETDENKLQMLRGSNLFETEIRIYAEILPEFQKTLKNIGGDAEIGPKCVYTSLQPKIALIFEDLLPLGFNVIRKRHPTMEEAKGAYFKLAKMHALSYKMALENPEHVDSFRHNTLVSSFFAKGEFMTDAMNLFLEVIRSVSSLSQFIPYIEAIKDKLLGSSFKSFGEYFLNRQKDALYVLCHGDFHTNNVMFKHNADSGKFEEALLIDFQTCYMGPIAIDLIYATFMLLSPETRLKHRDEMVYYYHTNFVDVLKKVGFNGRIPTLLDIRADMVRHRDYEIFLLCAFLPMVLGVRSGNVDLDQIMTSRAYRKELFYQNNYLDELHELLPIYLYSGYFENS